jgi:2',3'-cyclic-nucleotide 2'-phosphodiesterase (5'-nucleotidase family)
LGGLARRATIVDRIRNQGDSFLLLDAGNFFPDPKQRNDPKIFADISWQALMDMEYAAVNLGPVEFQFGLGFWENRLSSGSFPFVSSNLKSKIDDRFIGNPYMVLQIDGLKIGVIGVLSPTSVANFDFFQDSPLAEAAEVLPPQVAVETALDQLEGIADIIVLLAALPNDEAQDLMSRFEKIDIAINHDGGDSKPDEPVFFTGNRVLVSAWHRGTHLGHLKLAFGEGSIQRIETDWIELNDDVPAHDSTSDMIVNIYREGLLERRRQKKMKRWEEFKKEQAEILQLSPEEYFQTLEEGEPN